MTGGGEAGEGTATLVGECGACNVRLPMMRGYVSPQEAVRPACSYRGRSAPRAADRNSGTSGYTDFCTRWPS
jgi:hypothetical protein